jgi:hypothetical protein
MDEILNSAALVPMAGLQELRDWLVENGLPTHLWGIGQAKRVEDLWSELRTGESVLTSPPPERQVSFVSLVVKRGDKRLTEVTQLLASGNTRQRQWPPGEKMLPDEDAEAAAFRCVEEELGVSRESCRIVPGTHTEAVKKGESPSYPGLATRYRMHQVEMEVQNLPEAAFSTPESSGNGDTAVKMHYWNWI